MDRQPQSSEHCEIPGAYAPVQGPARYGAPQAQVFYPSASVYPQNQFPTQFWPMPFQTFHEPPLRSHDSLYREMQDRTRQLAEEPELEAESDSRKGSSQEEAQRSQKTEIATAQESETKKAEETLAVLTEAIGAAKIAESELKKKKKKKKEKEGDDTDHLLRSFQTIQELKKRLKLLEVEFKLSELRALDREEKIRSQITHEIAIGGGQPAGSVGEATWTSKVKAATQPAQFQRQQQSSSAAAQFSRREEGELKKPQERRKAVNQSTSSGGTAYHGNAVIHHRWQGEQSWEVPSGMKEAFAEISTYSAKFDKFISGVDVTQLDESTKKIMKEILRFSLVAVGKTFNLTNMLIFYGNGKYNYPMFYFFLACDAPEPRESWCARYNADYRHGRCNYMHQCVICSSHDHGADLGGKNEWFSKCPEAMKIIVALESVNTYMPNCGTIDARYYKHFNSILLTLSTGMLDFAGEYESE